LRYAFTTCMVLLPARRWLPVSCASMALVTWDVVATRDSMRALDCNEAAIKEFGCDPSAVDAQATQMIAGYSEEEIEWSNKEVDLQKITDRRECRLITTLLLGFVIGDAAILYLLNSTDPQVQAYSYKMLSSSIVVFSAQAVTNICENGIQWILSGRHVKKYVHMWLVTSLFFPWFFSISLLAFLLRERHDDLFAAVSLVAHVAAFSALEGLGDLQELLGEKLALLVKETSPNASISSSVHGRTDMSKVAANFLFCLYLVGPLAAFFTYRSVSTLPFLWRKLKANKLAAADKAAAHQAAADLLSHASGQPANGHLSPEQLAGSHRASLTPSDGVKQRHATGILTDAPVCPHGSGKSHSGHGHGDSHWQHEAFMAESESACIFTGFFVKQFVVYLVTGHPPPMDCTHDPKRCKVPVFEMQLLAAVVVGLYSIVVAISIYHTSISKTSKVLLRMQLLFSMSFSWTLMHLGDLVVTHAIWSQTDENSVLHSATAKKLASAALMSPLFVLVILFLDKLADHGKLDENTAETTVECIALLIGFYWEKVFGCAVHNVAKYSRNNFHSRMFVISLELGLILFVLPAWHWYIVPKASRPVPKRPRERHSELGGISKQALSGSSSEG